MIFGIIHHSSLVYAWILLLWNNLSNIDLVNTKNHRNIKSMTEYDFRNKYRICHGFEMQTFPLNFSRICKEWKQTLVIYTEITF